MSTRRQFVAALVTMILMAIAVDTASAQLGPPPLPPPCGAADLTVNNLSGCDLNLCLKATPPMNPWCFFVPAGAFGWLIPIPPGTTIGGIVGDANISYPFVAHPTIAGIWWVENITVSGCCVDVYYDPATCTMRVVPTTAPPPCQP